MLSMYLELSPEAADADSVLIKQEKFVSRYGIPRFARIEESFLILQINGMAA